MLRPALWAEVGEDERVVVVRNMFSTVRLPLAAIERLALEQVLFLWVGEKRYASPTQGRSRRAVIKGVPDAMPELSAADQMPYEQYVKSRLYDLMTQAQNWAGVRPGSADQAALGEGVRSHIDVLPIVVVAVPALLCV